MKRIIITALVFASALCMQAQEKLTISELAPFSKAWTDKDQFKIEREYGKLVLKYGSEVLEEAFRLLPTCSQCRDTRNLCYAEALMCPCMPCCQQTCDMQQLGCLIGCTVIPDISPDPIVPTDFLPFLSAHFSGNQTDLQVQYNKMRDKHGDEFGNKLKEYVVNYLPNCQTCITNHDNCFIYCASPTGGVLEPCATNCGLTFTVCIALCSIPSIQVQGSNNLVGSLPIK